MREITLLGQNVNSYHDRSEDSRLAFPQSDYTASAGFRNTFRSRGGAGAYFAELLREVGRSTPRPTRDDRARSREAHVSLQIVSETPELRAPGKSGMG